MLFFADSFLNRDLLNGHKGRMVCLFPEMRTASARPLFFLILDPPIMKTLVLLLTISLFPVFAATAEEPVLTEEAQAAFSWFEKLGFPDVAAAKWAEIHTGDWMQSGNAPPMQRPVAGFVLAEEGDRFTVLFPDLLQRDFEKTPANHPEHERVSWRDTSLQDHVRRVLVEVRTPGRRHGLFDRSGEQVAPCAEIFFLAYACHRHGEPGLTQELFDLAKARPGRWPCGVEDDST